MGKQWELSLVKCVCVCLSQSASSQGELRMLFAPKWRISVTPCHTLSHSHPLPWSTLCPCMPHLCVYVRLWRSQCMCVSVCGMSDVPHLQHVSCVISSLRAKQGEGQQERRKVGKESQRDSLWLLQTQLHIHISRTNPSTVVRLLCVNVCHLAWCDGGISLSITSAAGKW